MSSYSSEVKRELSRVTEQPCCNLAELASLMRMGGNLLLSGTNLAVSFTTENAAVARKVLVLIKGSYPVETEVRVSRGQRLKKNNTYMIRVLPSPKVRELLSVLGIFPGSNSVGKGAGGLLRRSCCRRAYLRGAFLGGGSVSRPEGEYHLELVTDNQEFAEALRRVLRQFGLPAGISDRKRDYVVYLKDGDAITSFLRLIGAHNALMSFENVRVVKEMRNQVNRLVNCETANLQKTVDASLRQVESIRRIQQRKGLQVLTPALREVAEARLAHPSATLQELADLWEGKMSKSGLNHRLRKLQQLADALPEGGQG